MPSVKSQKQTLSIVPLESSKSKETLDAKLTRILLNTTIDQCFLNITSDSNNLRDYTAYRMVALAMIEQDVDAIMQIIDRIDGPSPEDKDRDGCCNYFGSAIEDVLDLPATVLDGQTVPVYLSIAPTDPAIVALAKVVIAWANAPVNESNIQKRKQRNLAQKVVLERCGGKRLEPVKQDQMSLVQPKKWIKLELPYPDEPIDVEAKEV